jgi:hypothetical protein
VVGETVVEEASAVKGKKGHPHTQFRQRYFAFGGGPHGEDLNPPTFNEVIVQSNIGAIFAQVNDDNAVMECDLIIGKSKFPGRIYAGSPTWWEFPIPPDLITESLAFRLVCVDWNGNVSEFSGVANFGPGGAVTFSVTPAAAMGQTANAPYSILATGVTEDSNVPARITIKNTGDKPLQNIRLMLSPELKGKLILGEYAIQRIAPNSEYTISIMMNGKPNVDAMKQPIPYKGQIIISVDSQTPYIYELSGDVPNETASLQSILMKVIASKAEERYRSFEKPDLRISSDAKYTVTLTSGDEKIRNASDEIIIKNLGDKPIKNLRIITSTVGNHFLLDQKNIAFIPAGSFAKINLISNLNENSYPNLKGELVIVPENGSPRTVSIDIDERLPYDQNSKYEVRTISGKGFISNTADGIVIKNNSNEPIKNLRVILPRELAGVFSFDEASYKLIEPNSEVTIRLQQRGTLESIAKQILYDYSGEIILVSDNGMKRTVPVNISWKSISSEHFVIYARDNSDELTKAAQVINFLERNYDKVTEIAGESATKMVIYMPTSLEEMKMLSDLLRPSTYIYGEDVSFVWSNSEDVSLLALREFTYRTIINNYATYNIKQKLENDDGNWLVDGLANHITGKVVGERGMIKDELQAFIDEPSSLEWYGMPTQSQYGAAYSFFKYLNEKYGDTVIDKLLKYIGSSMISNHRCDTFEQCALLRAVYDANGMNINEKRHELSFAMIVEEWEQYVKENYSDVSDESD